MRAREKTAEAVVAKKAGNAAGAKGRRTKDKELEEELDIGAISDSNHGRNNYGSQLVSAGGRSGAAAGSLLWRDDAGALRTFRRRAMYETMMEQAVTDESYQFALAAVKRNKGAAGIDRMTTEQLETHLKANWWILKDKLLKGTYVPSPVRRVEIPKPSSSL